MQQRQIASESEYMEYCYLKPDLQCLNSVSFQGRDCKNFDYIYMTLNKAN